VVVVLVGACVLTVSVGVLLPPQPPSDKAAADPRAAKAASARLMTLRRGRAGAARSRGSR